MDKSGEYQTSLKLLMPSIFEAAKNAIGQVFAVSDWCHGETSERIIASLDLISALQYVIQFMNAISSIFSSMYIYNNQRNRIMLSLLVYQYTEEMLLFWFKSVLCSARAIEY